MTLERPDLSGIDVRVAEYIYALEAELTRLQSILDQPLSPADPQEPSEEPTTLNIITVSAAGMVKRTPRHLYFRQRRGGMGVFDIEMAQEDRPQFLVQADEADSLILVTNQARAFRLAVSQISETPVHARGRSIGEHLTLRDDERIAVIFPDSGGAHVVVVSRRGQVRRIAARYFGQSFQSGTVLYGADNGDGPVAACWTSGVDDLVIATRLGRAIRFSERQVPVRGCLGMRVMPGDEIVDIAATGAEDGVFLLTGNGKGTLRLMSGFAANKSPGTGGKVAMHTEDLVAALGVRLEPNSEAPSETDLFVISELG